MSSTLMIRDLDPETKSRLRVRAAENGRSMTAEARAILDSAVREHAALSLLDSLYHPIDQDFEWEPEQMQDFAANEVFS